jgi:hypothetical protein
MKTQQCCLCGEWFKGNGNNPRPLKYIGEACENCNFRYVIPARIKILRGSNHGKTKSIQIEK